MKIAFVSRALSRMASAALVATAIDGCAAHSTQEVQAMDLALGGGVVPLRGTTLSCAEFGQQHLPGTFGVDYTYPTHAEVDYFVGKGMTALRVPFLWERMQSAPNQPLVDVELARLDDVVGYATRKGASVILDPHNYARYYGQVVGADVPNATFADFWSRMANHYKSNKNVIFALMNEPHDLPTEQWELAAQAAIDAIRATGAANLILVPGVQWTGAHSWTESWYGTSNAVAMAKITDSKDNYAFEVHEYLDADFSGTHADCVSPTFGSEKMRAFTDWLRAHGKRGFLGELGGGANPTCFQAVDDQLRFVEANSDVYLGWSWWAAGPWWGDYFLSIEPANGQDKPMMAVLERHLHFSAPPPNPNPAPNPSPNPTPAPPPTPGTGSLTASMTVTSEWEAGYCVDVHVQNAGSAAVDGWTVVIDARTSSITQAWNAQVAHASSTYTLTPVGWNARIDPGSNADFGFCASKGNDGAKAVITKVR